MSHYNAGSARTSSPFHLRIIVRSREQQRREARETVSRARPLVGAERIKLTVVLCLFLRIEFV